MRAADEEEESAACVAALFDDAAAGSCAAKAALARVPQHKASYADAAYWRGRYAAELAAAAAAAGHADAPPAPYEWYDVSYEAFAAALASRVRPFRAGDVLLHVGCGSSAWGSRLAAQSHVAVLDSDVDVTLLARLREGAARSWLCFAALDATSLALRPGCADFVLDKGTVDALASAPESGRVIAAVASAALRALRPGGAFLMVSARPNERLEAMRAACDDRTAQALAAAEVAPLNDSGAGVLIVRK